MSHISKFIGIRRVKREARLALLPIHVITSCRCAFMLSVYSESHCIVYGYMHEAMQEW